MRLLFSVLILTSCLAAQDPVDWQGWMNKGIQEFRVANYHDAAASLQRAIDLNPNEALPRLYLGSTFTAEFLPGSEQPENLEMFRAAEDQFIRVLQANPGNREAVSNLALLHWRRAMSTADVQQKLQRSDEAASWYRQLIELDPVNRDAYVALGQIDWAKWYPAYTHAREQVGMKPADRGPISDPAVKLRLKQEYGALVEDGIEKLQHALQIDVNCADAMAYLNLFIRSRADLRDTPEEYAQDVAAADDWVQKALHAKAGSRTTTAPVPGQGPGRLQIAPNVQEANLIRKVAPEYPILARTARVQGSVVFTVIIGLDGSVTNVRLYSGHPLLVQAARAAVEQWIYKPTLLNGNPVEVVTSVEVTFRLEP